MEILLVSERPLQKQTAENCQHNKTYERVRMNGLFLFLCPKKKCEACALLSEMSARPPKKIKIVNSSAIGGNALQAGFRARVRYTKCTNVHRIIKNDNAGHGTCLLLPPVAVNRD